ncbi:ferredoxin FdxA [Paraburkholderia tagetis]|uniref:Ferredoxin n=1 Tax=Paraburkholderia tagetis TaxID=2913261 RepID=A0A9X1UEF8_9BURK|nr:ferredoxin FdxA [Paraburkholderia tagetis]MCG5073180.1 ferredoxin family protein [Paraburkholderia tagetis]
MSYVVTENCIQCRYTDCVEVCPTDCFRQGPNFLVIDPDECIDCGVCAPECPVDAIVPVEEVAENQQLFVALNIELAKQWPVITTRQAPLPEAERWRDASDKLQHLLKDAVTSST